MMTTLNWERLLQRSLVAEDTAQTHTPAPHILSEIPDLHIHYYVEHAEWEGKELSWISFIIRCDPLYKQEIK